MFFRIPFIRPLFEAADFLFFLAALFFLVWLISRIARSRRQGSRPEEASSEEEHLAQLCRQLEKMERRMENLETLLLDKDHKPDTERERRL